jgi:hypothetical protein
MDTLARSGLSGDSLYYFQALALEPICWTPWYCHQGCGGCNYKLVTDKLKLLRIKYPNSMLIDDATVRILEYKYMMNYGDDETLLAMNRDYETFLSQYSESNLRANIQFKIFENWNYMFVNNPKNEYLKKVRSTGQRFIREFSSDKRVKEVEERLK